MTCLLTGVVQRDNVNTRQISIRFIHRVVRNNGVGMEKKGLIERLQNGGNVLIAEGYIWEFERRGYIQAGSFVPEVVLKHPDLVRVMHQEFVHAGSDVCEALTYYGHREKLRFIGREDDLEKLNRTALKIAREVANETGTMMAGGICNTGVYEEDSAESKEKVKAMFKEQVEWAVEEGADYIIGETFCAFGEAKLALEAIQQHGKGLPAVITLACYTPDDTLEGIPIWDACRMLEEAGAAVVGLNCGRGPRTMIPTLREIKKVCKGPIAALPVPYRTNDKYRAFQALRDPETGDPLGLTNRSCAMCSRSDVRQFAEEAKKIGINYIGLCCGNASFYFREIAEVYGRRPEASNYSPDISMNHMFGDTEKTDKYNVDKIRQFIFGGKE